ncbi:TPA: hypothetical protein DCR49_07405 [Candidatus Delongbacteria bacterium]|nr:hypothetical protein [Candidatus Delongbacteria bacterium]
MIINFLGDIYLTSCVTIDPKLHLDNLVLSVEAPFTNNGNPALNKVNLFMNSEFLFKTFSEKKIIAVNLSNNHIMDYGKEGFDYTINILEKNKIPFFGAGKIEDNFHNPVIIENKIALFGYTCKSTNGVFGDNENTGAAPFELEKVEKDIKPYLRDYFVVINIHWGKEHYSFPKPDDVIKARSLIDKGVGLIIGNHPHKLQSMEIYKGRYIFYSLGNSLFHNVNQESCFNGKEFTKSFIWNFPKKSRISSKVCHDTETCNVSCEFLYHDKDKVFPYRSSLLKFKNNIVLGSRCFSLYNFVKQNIIRLEYYLKEPELILNKIKNIFKGKIL